MDTSEINIKCNVKLSMWSAIKLRIAGIKSNTSEIDTSKKYIFSLENASQSAMVRYQTKLVKLGFDKNKIIVQNTKICLKEVKN